MLFKILFVALLLGYETQIVFSQACTSRYSPYYTGTCVAPTSCEGAILNNLCSGSLKCCIKDTSYTPQSLVTASELSSITGLSNTRITFLAKVLTPPISNPTCNHKASYLSQLAHESGNFMYGEELGSEDYFSMYDYRQDLGNIYPGDGAKYRGRGFIQITGRSNYIRAGTALGLDLVNKPEMAAFPSVAARIAVWYWTSGSITNLNTLADGTFYSYTMMTYRINGGTNGLADRALKLEKAMSVFGCGTLIKGNGEACTIGGASALCKPMCVTGITGKSYCGCGGTTQTGLCKGPSTVICCRE